MIYLHHILTPTNYDIRRVMVILTLGLGIIRLLNLAALPVEYADSRAYGLALLMSGLMLRASERCRLLPLGRLVAGICATLMSVLAVDVWPQVTGTYLYATFALFMVAECGATE